MPLVISWNKFEAFPHSVFQWASSNQADIFKTKKLYIMCLNKHFAVDGKKQHCIGEVFKHGHCMFFSENI